MIRTTKIETPLGMMIAGATDKGLCLLEYAEGNRSVNELKDLETLLSDNSAEGNNMHLRQLKKELGEYFKGKRKSFSVKLLMPGSAFNISVWNELLKIPFGSTVSYIDQAEALGNPKAVRAVANANGKNRIAIVIPCHRVIGSGGELTGYGGGLTRKKWLLEHERKFSGQPTEQSLF